MSCLPLWHRRRSCCCLHSEEADALGLTLVYVFPDANNGENNSLHVFSKELNGKKESLIDLLRMEGSGTVRGIYNKRPRPSCCGN